MNRVVLVALLGLATSQLGGSPPPQQLARDYYAQGVEYINSGYSRNYDKAVQCFLQATRLKPDFAEAFCKLGEAYKLSDSYKMEPSNTIRERDAFRRAIDLRPDYAEAYVELGWTFTPKEPGPESDALFLEARELFQMAIHLQPAYAPAYSALAGSYLIQNDIARFLQVYESSLPAAPEAPLETTDLLHYCADKPPCDQVIDIYRRSAELLPKSFKAHYLLGIVYYFSKQYDRALDQFQEARQLQPNDVECLDYLGSLYLMTGDFEAAKGVYRRLRSLARPWFGIGPTNPGANLAASDLLSSIKEYSLDPDQ